jgi:hypothetical protein
MNVTSRTMKCTQIHSPPKAVLATRRARDTKRDTADRNTWYITALRFPRSSPYGKN